MTPDREPTRVPHGEAPRSDDAAGCARRAQQLLAQAHAATGFWRHALRMELLAEAQVYATLATRPDTTRPPNAEVTLGRALPRRGNA